LFGILREGAGSESVLLGRAALKAAYDAVLSEDAAEGRAGELRALIGIDDLGFTVMSQGVFESCGAPPPARQGLQGNFVLKYFLIREGL
jgi:hypothetical protein